MEALGAAASVVGLATVLTQLMKAVIQFQDFWSDVKDIPLEHQWLFTDLEIIRQVLEAIEPEAVIGPSTHQDTLLGLTVQNCTLHINNIMALMVPLQNDVQRQQRQITWKSIKALLRKDKMKEYRSNLESAKTNLVLLQHYISKSVSQYLV